MLAGVVITATGAIEVENRTNDIVQGCEMIFSHATPAQTAVETGKGEKHTVLIVEIERFLIYISRLKIEQNTIVVCSKNDFSLAFSLVCKLG